MNTDRDNNNTTKEKTMTKAQQTKLQNFINEMIIEEFSKQNIRFAIATNKKAFGIKSGMLTQVFIDFDLLD